MHNNLILTESMEDYLETILNLIKSRGTARVTDIAHSLGIAASSVNEGIKKLSQKGLVTQQKYGPIELTVLGKKKAERIDCTHQILYKFLKDILNIDPKIADQDACSIEHNLSDESIQAVVNFLAENNKIEEQNCAFRILFDEEDKSSMEAEKIMLADLKVGSIAEVKKIMSKGKLKRKLMDMGLTRGARIEIKGKAPMGDPIEVKLRGYNLSLRQAEAAEIQVKEV